MRRQTAALLAMALSACSNDAQISDGAFVEEAADVGASWCGYDYESLPNCYYGVDTDGNTGTDHGGFARSGSSNAWVHNWTGWNATTEILSLGSGWCTATAWIESSSNLTAGYFSVLGDNGAILAETRIQPGSGYRSYSVGFYAPTAGYAPIDGWSVRSKNVGVRAGLWGNGALSWLRMDDIVVSCRGY